MISGLHWMRVNQSLSDGVANSFDSRAFLIDVVSVTDPSHCPGQNMKGSGGRFLGDHGV
jgi:hypothetical protein